MFQFFMSREKKIIQKQLEKAKSLGKKAYKRGLLDIPTKDNALILYLDNLPDSTVSTKDILTSWHEGYQEQQAIALGNALKTCMNKKLI